MTPEQEFLSRVKAEAENRGYEIFAVTGKPGSMQGASIYRGQGKGKGSAAWNARRAHMSWERGHGIDSQHDWSKATGEMKKEAISALEGGFLQVRKGRRPIGVDRLLGRSVGKQSVSDLVQKKVSPSKFMKRAEDKMMIPWIAAEPVLDILEKTAAREELVPIADMSPARARRELILERSLGPGSAHKSGFALLGSTLGAVGGSALGVPGSIGGALLGGTAGWKVGGLAHRKAREQLMRQLELADRANVPLVYPPPAVNKQAAEVDDLYSTMTPEQARYELLADKVLGSGVGRKAAYTAAGTILGMAGGMALGGPGIFLGPAGGYTGYELADRKNKKLREEFIKRVQLAEAQAAQR